MKEKKITTCKNSLQQKRHKIFKYFFKKIVFAFFNLFKQLTIANRFFKLNFHKTILDTNFGDI